MNIKESKIVLIISALAIINYKSELLDLRVITIISTCLIGFFSIKRLDERYFFSKKIKNKTCKNLLKNSIIQIQGKYDSDNIIFQEQDELSIFFGLLDTNEKKNLTI